MSCRNSACGSAIWPPASATTVGNTSTVRWIRHHATCRMWAGQRAIAGTSHHPRTACPCLRAAVRESCPQGPWQSRDRCRSGRRRTSGARPRSPGAPSGRRRRWHPAPRPRPQLPPADFPAKDADGCRGTCGRWCARYKERPLAGRADEGDCLSRVSSAISSGARASPEGPSSCMRLAGSLLAMRNSGQAMTPRQEGGCAAEMPLADHRGEIPARLERLRERDLVGVDAGVVPRPQHAHEARLHGVETVSSAPRVGVHSGMTVNCVRRAPSDAMRSRWGVRIVGAPYDARSPYPRSSATITTKLAGPGVAVGVGSAGVSVPPACPQATARLAATTAASTARAGLYEMPEFEGAVGKAEPEVSIASTLRPEALTGSSETPTAPSDGRGTPPGSST
jgi:hypothetical protein